MWKINHLSSADWINAREARARYAHHLYTTPPYLTLAEIAEVMGLNKQTVFEIMKIAYTDLGLPRPQRPLRRALHRT